MTTFLTFLLITLVAFSLSTLDAAPAPVCPLAGSSMATLEHVGDDPTAYELTFKWNNREDVPVDFVDYHYRINDGEFMNVRAYDGSTPATEATYAITLHPGDVLHAMLTYSSNRVGCEVAISEHRTPAPATASAPVSASASASASTAATSVDETLSSASTSTSSTSHTIAATPISCTHINQQLVHDGTGFNIHTELPQDATKVDAHVNMNGADPINIRMIPSSTPGVYELPAPFIASVDSTINYYLTFASDSAHTACDTQTWSTAAEASDLASASHLPDSTSAAAAPASVPPVAARRPHTRPRSSMPPAAPTPAPAPASSSSVPSTPAAETETAAPVPPAAAVTASSADPSCSLPAITHRVMRIGATGNQYIIEANSAEETPYAYIDVHAMVGETENNARIGVNTASAHSEPITIESGEALNYYLTYASDDHHACNTRMYSTGPMA